MKRGYIAGFIDTLLSIAEMIFVRSGNKKTIAIRRITTIRRISKRDDTITSRLFIPEMR